MAMEEYNRLGPEESIAAATKRLTRQLRDKSLVMSGKNAGKINKEKVKKRAAATSSLDEPNLFNT
jgi:hypothetical protein